MKTRNGKIARLPKKIREELNQRLDNGQQGPLLLPWLNELPEVKEVLKESFDSQPISKQNLSDWRLGGFQEWLRHQERRVWVRRAGEEGDELKNDQGAYDGYESIARVMMAELAHDVHSLHEITDKKERWHRFREMSRELVRLQSEYHRGLKVDLARDRWELEMRREEENNENPEPETENAVETEETHSTSSEAEASAESGEHPAPNIEHPASNEDGNEPVKLSRGESNQNNSSTETAQPNPDLETQKVEMEPQTSTELVSEIKEIEEAREPIETNERDKHSGLADFLRRQALLRARGL